MANTPLGGACTGLAPSTFGGYPSPIYDHPRTSKEYSRYSIAELNVFAANRGVKVAREKALFDFSHVFFLQSDYVQALERDDATATFRFLDLSPELRNYIYEDLLTIDDDVSIEERKPGTCYPQILRTCKFIQAEATSILYAENVIDVEIYSDRIEAHGIRCGSHTPALPSPAVGYEPFLGAGSFMLDSIVWPDFLRRAWTICVSVPDDTWEYVNNQQISDQQRAAAINNVFYSFCLMLSSGTRCKELWCDLVGDAFTAAEFQACYYPMRLLGPEWKETYRGQYGSSFVQGAGQGELFPQDAKISEHVAALSAGTIAPKATLLRKVLGLLRKIEWHKASDGQWRPIIRKPIVCAAYTLTSAMLLLLPDSLPRSQISEDSTAQDLIDKLRLELIWEVPFLNAGIQDELLDEIDLVLHLDIELRAPKVDQGE